MRKIVVSRTRTFQISAILLAVISALWILRTSNYDVKASSDPMSFPKEGFFAPEILLADAKGNPYSLSDYAGNPVLINFWASWCPPCRAEMPALQEVHLMYQQQGVTVLGINVSNQDSFAAALGFVEEVGVTFPVLFDVSGDIAATYNVRALPSTYFVDKDGKINKVIIGGPLSEALVKSELSELLKDGE